MILAGQQNTAGDALEPPPCSSQSNSSTFEWCGGVYSWQDLQEALATLCGQPHDSQGRSTSQGTAPQQRGQSASPQWTPAGQHSDQQSSIQVLHEASHTLPDPWAPDSWHVLNADGCALLQGLNSADTIPWVSTNNKKFLSSSSFYQ